MSLADYDLDEPSELDLCEIHGETLPCPHCRNEAADREYDDE